MQKLPIDHLADFADRTLYRNLHEAQAECLQLWIEFENQPLFPNLDAWRHSWDYQDAVYFELARRENTRLLQECAAILAPRRNGKDGRLGGIAV